MDNYDELIERLRDGRVIFFLGDRCRVADAIAELVAERDRLTAALDSQAGQYEQTYGTIQDGLLAHVQTLTAERDAKVAALRQLTLVARTSGGTLGPDFGLMAACDAAETLLTLRK